MQGRAKFRMSSYASNKLRPAIRRIVRSKFNKLFLFVSVFLLLITSLSALYAHSFSENNTETKRFLTQNAATTKSPQENIASYQVNTTAPKLTPTQTLTPTPTVHIEPTLTPTPEPAAEKGVATQVDENTWSVSLETDSEMANVNEVFQALNSYRSKRGVGTLAWDGTLASFAQSRADFFNSQGSLDGHAGFRDYMDNGGFEKSGFNGLGENSAFMAGPMGGTKIIESLFAADAPHDDNQTDAAWTHVGIGLSGNAVNVNFGKNKR